MQSKKVSDTENRIRRPSENLKQSRRPKPKEVKESVEKKDRKEGAKEKTQEDRKEEKEVKEEKDDTTNLKPTTIPKLIFVVPYRDRENQVAFFQRHMKYILEDYHPNDYKILICHQNDTRSFNCGAMKNIGFLIAKQLYPKHYENITFVFNDVDTLPFVKNKLQYETTFRNIKHFYGFKHTLGGIVAIKGADFETLHGYPNFWAWGYEDNLLYDRALQSNMRVDRDHFYEYADKDIMHFQDGYTKKVNKSEFERYAKGTLEGIHSIYRLSYHYNPETGFYDVDFFMTTNPENIQQRTTHDLHQGTTPFRLPAPRRAAMSMRL